MNNSLLDIEEYIRQKEPEKLEKAYNWKTAIGLQDVDGLKTSDYLISLAKDNIDGKISLEETNTLLSTYYKQKDKRNDENRTEEADKVSLRISAILAEKTFVFSPSQLVSIHKRLFDGIYKFAGKYRDYNITKNEWVLNGETVLYSSYDLIRDSLDYDFNLEKDFNYSNASIDEAISHIAKFISGIWQIHAFGEGNTRTTAVFTIKYLKSLGFNVTNQLFEHNSLYFRNALVRANYQNYNLKIDKTTKYLEIFLRNLLLNEHNELKNRYLHLDYDKFIVKEEKRTGTEQADRTSTEQVPNKLTEQAKELLSLLKDNEYPLSELMELVLIKHRPTFLKKYLNPLLESGYLKRKYFNKTHPDQKYLLTEEGKKILGINQDNMKK